MYYKPDTNPGMLLANQQSTRNDNNNAYYEDPSIEDSSSISDNDDTYFEDSDDEEMKERKQVTKKENADYTLKAGTIIIFRPESVFGNPAPIRARVIKIKTNCDTDPFPLVVEPFQLVSRTKLIQTEGKVHSFFLKNVKLEPGFIPKQIKPM